jgi:hypothetical protein
MHDQEGMRRSALPSQAWPKTAPGRRVHRGRYHRLRVDRYRILYVIDGDVITVERVDRVP